MNENYDKILSQIDGILKIDKLQNIESTDESLLETATKENGLGAEYNYRDHQYSMLLRDYVDLHKSKAKANKVYKGIFFALSMFIFVGMAICSVIVMFIVSNNGNNSLSDIAVVASSAASIISVIIVIPKIIAEHLLPTNEDEHMIGIVKNMQTNDGEIRSYKKNK